MCFYVMLLRRNKRWIKTVIDILCVFWTSTGYLFLCLAPRASYVR